MKFDFSQMERNLEKMANRADVAVRSTIAEPYAEKMQTYAIQNRPWDDHTFRARDGLKGYVSAIHNGYRITIAHGVEYGYWLENAHNKKYAILQQTVNYISPEVMRSFNRFMDRLGL